MSEEALKLDSPWNEFLNEIDELQTAPTQIICIGGFVVTKIHGFSRNTGDLDYIESPSELAAQLDAIAGKGSPLHKKYNLYVDYVGALVTMPINFDERLMEVSFQFKNLKIFIPDVYDLILSKMERNSPKDYEDVHFLAEKYSLGFAILRKRFDEELDFIPNRERHISTLNFWREWFQE
jgi:hypothetical protein